MNFNVFRKKPLLAPRWLMFHRFSSLDFKGPRFAASASLCHLNVSLKKPLLDPSWLLFHRLPLFHRLGLVTEWEGKFVDASMFPWFFSKYSLTFPWLVNYASGSLKGKQENGSHTLDARMGRRISCKWNSFFVLEHISELYGTTELRYGTTNADAGVGIGLKGGLTNLIKKGN